MVLKCKERKAVKCGLKTRVADSGSDLLTYMYLISNKLLQLFYMFIISYFCFKPLLPWGPPRDNLCNRGCKLIDLPDGQSYQLKLHPART